MRDSLCVPGRLHAALLGTKVARFFLSVQPGKIFPISPKVSALRPELPSAQPRFFVPRRDNEAVESKRNANDGSPRSDVAKWDRYAPLGTKRSPHANSFRWKETYLWFRNDRFPNTRSLWKTKTQAGGLPRPGSPIFEWIQS